MVANILPIEPLPPDPRVGSIGPMSTFSEHGHVAYEIKINGNHLMQQHGSKYFAHRTTIPLLPDPRVGSIGPMSTFSEHGHVAYQIRINGNHLMQQHGSKYFAHRPLLIHPHPPDHGFRVNRLNSTFSAHGHVAYQRESGMQQMVANILPADPLPPPPPPDPGVWGQKVGIQIFCLQTTLTIDPWVGFKGSKYNFIRAWSCCISN